MLEGRRMMDYLRGLKNVYFSGEEFEEKEISGEYNIIDLSGAKGKKLVIESEFTNVLDLSFSEIEEVILGGKYNLVDASLARIKKLDRNEVEIIALDTYKAKIE